MQNLILNALNGAISTTKTFLDDSSNLNAVSKSIDIFLETIQSGNKIFSCGNGGSMCDALHFAEELTGKFSRDRRPLPAIAISDPTHMTCVGNDYGFDYIFSRYIEGHARSGDSLLAISTSGNSPNVINAINQAKKSGIKTVALIGKDGGKIKDIADVSIIVKSDKTERIQEVHTKIVHIFIEGIEKGLFS